MEAILRTPDGKRVKINTNDDVCLYDAPHNPPNTGTTYTRGMDLHAHKARSGAWYFYFYHWSMWQGEDSSLELVTEEEAKNFVLDKAELTTWGLSGSEEEKALEIWPDIFEETA